MAKTVRWSTPRGATIDLTLATTTTIRVDGHDVEVPGWSLTAWVVGTTHHVSSPAIADRPGIGPALVGNNIVIPISANVLADVTGMVNDYHAEVARRCNSAAEADHDYHTRYDAIVKAMAE